MTTDTGLRSEAPLSLARELWLLSDRCMEEAMGLIDTGTPWELHRVLETYFIYFEANSI